MTIAVIILSILASYLLYKLYKKSDYIDAGKVLSNRSEMHLLAYNDWKEGKIDKEFFRAICFVFHPDFNNTWDYVPPERQEYTGRMRRLDSNFWKTYKITPDFVIPANIVYELYKVYFSQQMNMPLHGSHTP